LCAHGSSSSSSTSLLLLLHLHLHLLLLCCSRLLRLVLRRSRRCGWCLRLLLCCCLLSGLLCCCLRSQLLPLQLQLPLVRLLSLQASNQATIRTKQHGFRANGML
jgi:hypothetical protein